MNDDELYEWAYRHALETTGSGPVKCHEYAVLAVLHRRPDLMRREIDKHRLTEYADACEHPRDLSRWCTECRPSDGQLRDEIARLRSEVARLRASVERFGIDWVGDNALSGRDTESEAAGQAAEAASAEQQS